MTQALCVGKDPRDWDPLNQAEAATGANVRPHLVPRISRAMAVCVQCPVKAECLKTGIETEQQGVWGGKYLSRESRGRWAA